MLRYDELGRPGKHKNAHKKSSKDKSLRDLIVFQDLVDFVDGNRGAIEPTTPIMIKGYSPLYSSVAAPRAVQVEQMYNTDGTPYKEAVVIL